MNQHCGKLGDHPPHRHWARLRPVVTPCVCDEQRCVCPEPEPVTRPRRRFSCDGKQVRSTEVEMTTVVDVRKTDRCSVCGHYFVVSEDGTIRLHDDHDGRVCPGSGRTPAEPIQWGWLGS